VAPEGGGVTTRAETNGWDGEGFAHEAFFFDDDDGLTWRCRPFIEDGLDRQQPVLVIGSQNTLAALEADLGPAVVASLAAFEPAEGWWRGPHATMAAYLASMQPLLAAGTPWRLVAEPAWLASVRGRYWSRFEAVANVSLADFPYYSLCLHDLRRLDAEAVAEARCTHPVVNDGTAPARSPQWQGAVQFLDSVEPRVVPAPHGARTVVHSSLPAVREQVLDAGSQTGLRRYQVADLVLAADELAANSLAVAEEVTVTTWRTGDRFVVEVRDRGPGFVNPLAGYVPPRDPRRPGGRGLWLARALSDDLAISATPSGVTAQLHALVPA
jgi:anti-sigma regulatory factor (Ser/Thr protein kinase)